MKRISIITLTILLILSIVLSLVGCGTYKPPITTDNPYEDDTTTKPDPTPPSTDPDEEKLVFTVTLYSEGRRFSPNVTFYAQWTSEDKTEIINAPFNALGVAKTEGLDGEYRVTLSGLPNDYTYDPNGIYVDNDHRDVKIDLLPIIATKNKGTDYYTDCIEVSKLGTYRHTFTAKDQRAWFRYYPTAQGKYVIESWVDVTENEVNPVMVHYVGSTQYVNLDYPAGIYDEGGTSSTYSKNFKFELELSKGMVGNVWIFQLYANCKGEYPVNVDFTIKLIGDYGGTEEVYEPVLPNGPFLNTRPSGTWQYNYADNAQRLDDARFKLKEDGFYYEYDAVKYASNNGWGPMLFAKITKDAEAMNYSEGGDSGGFANNPLVRLRFNGKDYTTMIKTYATYCNSDGAHPVTEELKEFLQAYAIANRMFADGGGQAEQYYNLIAGEADMWLFACGYYK